MFRSTSISCVAAAAVLLLGGTTFAAPIYNANLLTNPGFESGTTGWSLSSASAHVSTPTHTGAGALSTEPAVVRDNYDVDSSGNIDISDLPAETTFRASFWANATLVYDTAIQPTVRVNYTDGTNDFFGHDEMRGLDTGGGWVEVAWEFTTGSGKALSSVDFFRIRVKNTGGDAGSPVSSADQIVYLDDASLVAIAVPEPASLALIGLGGLLIVGRRRRA